MRDATEIRYEALGMDCLAYTEPNASSDEIERIICKIAPTAFVYRICQSKCSEKDFELLNLSKVQDFLNETDH